MITTTDKLLSVLDLIKNNNKASSILLENIANYIAIIDAAPATGVLYITKASPQFIGGHVRLRGRDNGKYPNRSRVYFQQFP